MLCLITAFSCAPFLRGTRESGPINPRLGANHDVALLFEDMIVQASMCVDNPSLFAPKMVSTSSAASLSSSSSLLMSSMSAFSSSATHLHRKPRHFQSLPTHTILRSKCPVVLYQRRKRLPRSAKHPSR